MNRRELEIAGAAVHDIPSLYAELNRVFMPEEAWTLGESLDALDDVLHGGFGVLRGAETVRVVWRDSAVARAALGVAVTREVYLSKLERPDIYAAPAARRALDALDAGDGETYFDLVVRVFRGHGNIDLVLA